MTATKTNQASVHFKLDNSTKNKLSKMIAPLGFDSLSEFFRVVANNFVRGKVEINLSADDFVWGIDPEYAKELDRIEEEEVPYGKEFKNTRELIEDLFKDE